MKYLFFIAALILASTVDAQMENYYFLNIKGQVGFLVEFGSDEALTPTLQGGIEWKAQINTHSSSYGALFARINNKDNVNGLYEGGFKLLWSAFNGVDRENGILSLGPFVEMSFAGGGKDAVLSYILGVEFTYKTGDWVEVFVNTSKNLNLFSEGMFWQGGWLAGVGMSIDISQTWKNKKK